MIDSHAIWSNDVEVSLLSDFDDLGFQLYPVIFPSLAEARREVPITFSWNTTDWGYGNYILNANASKVQGETDSSDNTLLQSSVGVTIPGDMNGDFQVSLTDLVMLANSYGSKPGDANWNPNADIDGDGKVSLQDLVILANHYGQHNP